MCMRKFLDAGNHSRGLEEMMPEGHTGPGIAPVPNGQSEKSHNSWGIRVLRRVFPEYQGK